MLFHELELEMDGVMAILYPPTPILKNIGLVYGFVM